MIAPSATGLSVFWCINAACWAMLGLLIWKRPAITKGAATRLIFAGSIALHLAALIPQAPSLSDDIWRYVLDGQRVASGANPYALSPAEIIEQNHKIFSDHDRLTLINNPELVTIYQPTSQIVFGVTMAAYDWVTPGPPSMIVGQRLMRVVFSGINLLIVGLLIAQLIQINRSPWWATLYAWHPLTISEVAWSGHQDVIGILFLLLALRLGQAAGRSWMSGLLAGVCLGLAAAVKPVVLPIALPLAWHLRHAPLRILPPMLTCIAVLAASYSYFASFPEGLGRMFETAETFVGIWRFNGSIHPLIEHATLIKHTADVLCGVALAAILLIGTWMQRTPWRVAMTYLFASLCLSSTVHPWYLLWALALLPLAWSAGRLILGPAVWVASLTLPWAYVAWLRAAGNEGFTLTPAHRLLIWLPVYLAIAIALWVYRGPRTPADNLPVKAR